MRFMPSQVFYDFNYSSKERWPDQLLRSGYGSVNWQDYFIINKNGLVQKSLENRAWVKN